MKYKKAGVLAALALMFGYGLAQGQAVQRLTDNLSEKPCIVVSADGSHVAWMEARQEAAPVNKTYLIKSYDINSRVTTDLLRVPGITSNQPMQILVGDKAEIKGPNFIDTDLNYRIIGDITKVRLSEDGRYLITCVEEQFNYTKRAPFFVLVDLQQNTFEVIPLQVPDGLGAITGDQITSKMNLMYWDFNPAGTHLVYLLDSVNYRGNTVVLHDIQTKTSRRVLGYERAGYVAGALTIEGPEDQKTLYGNKLGLGDDILVVAGKNGRNREGLWMVSLSQGTSVWHEAAYVSPGVSAGHVFYSSQKPAVWLNPDGTEGAVFEQQVGINNQAALPFWSGSGSAYVTDQAHASVLQLGSGDPVPVAKKAEMGVPQAWRFQLKGTSSADSYRLVSDAGGTLVLPVSDPKDSRRLDLFVITRDVAKSSASAAASGSEAGAFSSRVDAFEIGSLLKPGELSGKFMPADVKAASAAGGTGETVVTEATNATGTTSITLPPLPSVGNWDVSMSTFVVPESGDVDIALSDTAEQVYGQARMMLMLGDLNDATMASVIERMEKAVELDPANREYRLNLARGYVAANTMLSVGAGIEEYSLLLQKDNKESEPRGPGFDFTPKGWSLP